METSLKVIKEFIDVMKIDAGIRIQDYNGFFDANGRRLRALLEVASNCEVSVSHIRIKPVKMAFKT